MDNLNDSAILADLELNRVARFVRRQIIRIFEGEGHCHRWHVG